MAFYLYMPFVPSVPVMPQDNIGDIDDIGDIGCAQLDVVSSCNGSVSLNFIQIASLSLSHSSGAWTSRTVMLSGSNLETSDAAKIAPQQL